MPDTTSITCVIDKVSFSVNKRAASFQTVISSTCLSLLGASDDSNNADFVPRTTCESFGIRRSKRMRSSQLECPTKRSRPSHPILGIEERGEESPGDFREETGR